MNCDRCNGPTNPKRIISKKDNKEYTVYVCLSGCMNGQFPYSRFAPKTNYPKPAPGAITPPAAFPKDSTVDVLRLILKELEAIRKELVAQQEPKEMIEEEPPF
jgi:hypothetical protein